tara:strand:+ start:44846 stop:46189 length:1344 start_codon:yes stop_codon:yes gene_type:complete
MKFFFSILFFSIINFSGLKSQEISNLFNYNLYGFATSNTFTYFNVYDNNFLNKVKKINPQVLRFPGGAVGNFYHFGKNGYGFDFNEIEIYDGSRFVERSKALNQANIDKGHTHDYIDDFIYLAKNTNSKVVLVANMFSRNDDIIKMIKKIQDNNLEIIGVELGSELSNKSFFDKGYTIDEYIIDAKRCSDLVKENYPNIKTAIVAAPIHSSSTHRHTIWNKKLSEMNFYDAIIIHSYAKVVKGKKQYGQMISFEEEGNNDTEAFEIYLDRCLSFLFELFPKEIQKYNSIFDKEIWITEWNLQIAKKTSNTMFQALYVSQYFLELMSNKKLMNITLTTYHNLGGRDYGGSIFRNNKEKFEIQSPYSSLLLLSKIFEKNITIIKKKKEDKKYYYQCYNNNGQKLITYVIDWQECSLTLIGENIHKFYSNNLYDKAHPEGILFLKNNEIN